MKKINILTIFFICILLSSCNAYKYKYGAPTAYKQDEVLEDAKYLNKNEAFLCFTKNFENTFIKVFQKNNVLFEGRVNTSEGIAKVLEIDKGFDVKIYIEGVKGHATVGLKDMSGYKYVYVYKIGNRGIVHFFDGTMKFDKQDILFPD